VISSALAVVLVAAAIAACSDSPVATEFVPAHECDDAAGVAAPLELIAARTPVVDDDGRDPARWPFAVDSPWNTPLGEDATFAAPEDPRTRALTDPAPTAWVNAGEFSQPIYQASEDDPLVTFSREGCRDIRYRVPEGARPATGDDAHLNVIDPTGRYVDESWATHGSPPHLTTGHHVRNDLRGPGVGEGGSRAYGGSAIGGLIRVWEVDAGRIRHVLALGLTDQQLGQGPVWPATSEDGDAGGRYGGPIPMGTLVALPPDVDIASLGLGPAGASLAHALQDYGAYVVDRSGSVSLYAEPRLEHRKELAGMRQAVVILRPLLRVVTDNGPSSVGGAGPRRARPAPPLR
jgi:hypothetical protein